MAIIDYNYFTKKLNLPQTGNTEGRNEVIRFIDTYENEFLKKALGYDLWKAFSDGIAGSGSPDQRWLDLLEGKEFTYQSRTDKWVGFAPVTSGGSYSINSDNFLELTAGGPEPEDPAPGTTITLPAAFQDVTLAVYIRGTGRLKTSEFTVVGATLTFNGGIEMSLGTVVFIEKGNRLSISSGDLLYVSPIANYVYYQFIENNAMNTVLIGTVVSKTDNNRNVNPVPKLVDAWNRMADMLYGLYGFLQANKDTYPEWSTRTKYADWYWLDIDYGFYNYPNCLSEVYQKKNSLDL